MPETAQFTIGSKANCPDGECGELSRVVVDPVAKAVTDLVIDPKHSIARLVPLELVDASSGEIQLHCTKAEFEKLDPAEETRFLQISRGYAGYGPGQAIAWPYYGYGEGLGLGMGGMGLGLLGNITEPVTTDTVPLGEVDVNRGDQVHATDGEIGRVQGLIINPHDRHVTHILLQEGHLWGRQQVAIPIGSVTKLDTGIQLNISKQQVQDLPPVEATDPDALAPKNGPTATADSPA